MNEDAVEKEVEELLGCLPQIKGIRKKVKNLVETVRLEEERKRTKIVDLVADDDEEEDDGRVKNLRALIRLEKQEGVLKEEIRSRKEDLDCYHGKHTGVKDAILTLQTKLQRRQAEETVYGEKIGEVQREILLMETELLTVEKKIATLRDSAGPSQDMICCICLGGRKNSVFMPCFHGACLECATKCHETTGRCPQCREPIASVKKLYF